MTLLLDSSLFSCFGWTIYKEALICKDPANYVRNRIWVQKGVPYYNGIVSRRVHDGPENISQEAITLQPCELQESDANHHVARCALRVTLAKPLLSTTTEEWKMSQRFFQSPEDRVTVNVGYNLLTWSMEDVYHISECSHSHTAVAERHKQLTEFTKNPVYAMTKGFHFSSSQILSKRIYIAQTLGNHLARWLAVVCWKYSHPIRLAVIRKGTVCLDCFITKASKLDDGEGPGLYLIL